MGWFTASFRYLNDIVYVCNSLCHMLWTIRHCRVQGQRNMHDQIGVRSTRFQLHMMVRDIVRVEPFYFQAGP